MYKELGSHHSLLQEEKYVHTEKSMTFLGHKTEIKDFNMKKWGKKNNFIVEKPNKHYPRSRLTLTILNHTDSVIPLI